MNVNQWSQVFRTGSFLADLQTFSWVVLASCTPQVSPKMKSPRQLLTNALVPGLPSSSGWLAPVYTCPVSILVEPSVFREQLLTLPSIWSGSNPCRDIDILQMYDLPGQIYFFLFFPLEKPKFFPFYITKRIFFFSNWTFNRSLGVKLAAFDFWDLLSSWVNFIKLVAKYVF